MLVYLIRHGETDLNKKKILQGQSDFELNNYGRELAKVTGAALKHIRFDKAYTSPLKRAKETAQLFLAENENELPKLQEEKLIQEISFGDYEGYCYGKEEADFGAAFCRARQRVACQALLELERRTGKG